MNREWYEVNSTKCPNYDSISGTVRKNYADVCSKKADTYEEVKNRFGYRDITTPNARVQSWCENCRKRERELDTKKKKG